jgi:hypothetical protein
MLYDISHETSNRKYIKGDIESNVILIDFVDNSSFLLSYEQ